MVEYIKEQDIANAVARLQGVLSTVFLREFFGRDELDRLERMVQKQLESRELLELIVRSEGAELLASRVARIGRGKTSVREKLLDSLSDSTIRELYVALRHQDPPVQRGRIVNDLTDFKWTRGSSSALRMTRALGLPDSYAGLREQGARDRMYEISPHAEVPPLKPFQHGVLHSLERCLATNGRAVVSSFTGTGKTRIGMEYVIARLIADDEPTLVVWVAQKRELLDQACDACDELWPWRAGKTGQALTLYRYLEGNEFEPLELTDRPSLLIATSQQLIARIKHGDPFLLEAFRRTQLLLIDEAHFALAQGHKTIIEAYAQLRGEDSAKVLGMTATPGRSNLASPDESRMLAQLFGNRLIVPSHSGKPTPLAWFQDQQVLSRIDHRKLPAPSQIAQTLGKLGMAEQSDGQRDYTDEFLGIVGGDSMRNRAILHELTNLNRLGRSALVFCCNIKQADQLCHALLVTGVPAAVVHHKIDPRDRRGIIRKFRKGELRLLLNVEVLTTGFDAPKCDTLVMCRPTLSPILYEQMVGRGLRGPAMGGTDRCEIVDFTDNFSMFQEPQAYERFWNDWDPTGDAVRQETWRDWVIVHAEPEIEQTGIDDAAYLPPAVAVS